MHISQLQPGNTIADEQDGTVIHFQVVDIVPLGSKFEVTFISPLGTSSAVYPGNGYVAVTQ